MLPIEGAGGLGIEALATFLEDVFDTDLKALMAGLAIATLVKTENVSASIIVALRMVGECPRALPFVQLLDLVAVLDQNL